MKKILLIVVAALAVLVGLFMALNSYIYNEKQGGSENLEGVDVALVGTVTNVNLDGILVDGPGLVTFSTDTGESHVIAVPSMGINLCAAASNIAFPSDIEAGDLVEVKGVLNESEQIVPCEDESHYLRAESVIEDEEVGLSFVYRKGPDGYVLTEIPEASENPEFVKAYMLMAQSDYLDMQNASAPREGPPTIMVRAYRNTENLQPAVWAEQNPSESNIQSVLGELKEAIVGGANATRYTADGLYAMDTFVVAHGDHVYVLTGSYIDTESMIHDDFETFVDTLAFIPLSGQ